MNTRSEILANFKTQEDRKEKINQNFFNNATNWSFENLDQIELFIISNFSESLNFKYENYLNCISFLVDELTEEKNNLSYTLFNNELTEKLKSNNILDRIDLEIKYQSEIESDIGFIDYRDKKLKLNNIIRLCNFKIIELKSLIERKNIAN